MKYFKIITLFSVMMSFIILLTGCPYESKYTLIGKPRKHPENIVGQWFSDSVALTITARKDNLLYIVYKDHENEDKDSIFGVASIIQSNQNTYISLKIHATETYFIAKIEKVRKSHLVINIMDDKILKKKDSFTSDKDFSDFVFSNQKDIFLPDNKVLFIKNIAQ